MTVLVAAITLAEAIGSLIAARLPALGARSQSILAGAGVIAITAAMTHPSALVAAVVGLAFLEGLAHPLRSAAIQRLAADGVRARAASIASACDKVCATIALTLAGVAGRRGTK
jgi:hypothetical protein